MSRFYTTKSGQRIKFPDDATPEEMQSIADSYDKAQPFQLAAMPSFSQMARNRVTAALPATLGALGGVAGTASGGPFAVPMGIAGAALGGDAGYRLQQAVIGQAANPRQAERAGLGQAGAEVLGQGFGRVAGRFGRGLIPKTVTFQKPATPSVILNEFGKPFMNEGQVVTFTKGATTRGKHAAGAALDVAAHLVQGGPLVRAATKGLQSKAAGMTPALGSWLTSTSGQNFARQFPRAAAALYHVLTYQDQPDTMRVSAPFARR